MSTLHIWPEAWAQGLWPGQPPDRLLLESKWAHSQHASLLRGGGWGPTGSKEQLLNPLLSCVRTPSVRVLLLSSNSKSVWVLPTHPAHGRAEGLLSFHQVGLGGTGELGCTTSRLLLSALKANFCVDIASKHLSAPQVQESWIFASQKRNLSVTDQAEGNNTVYLTVWMAGKWRHKHWFRPKPNTEFKPGPSEAQLTSYFTLPRKQNSKIKEEWTDSGKAQLNKRTCVQHVTATMDLVLSKPKNTLQIMKILVGHVYLIHIRIYHSWISIDCFHKPFDWVQCPAAKLHTLQPFQGNLSSLLLHLPYLLTFYQVS